MKPKSDLVALPSWAARWPPINLASLEIEQDTGSTSHANTESIDVIELDGVVRAGSLNSAPHNLLSLLLAQWSPEASLQLFCPPSALL